MNVICDIFLFKLGRREFWNKVWGCGAGFNRKFGIKEYGCLGNYIVKSGNIKSMDDMSSIKIRIYPGQTNMY